MLLICEIAQYTQASELKKEHMSGFETRACFLFLTVFTDLVFTDWYIELIFVL